MKAILVDDETQGINTLRKMLKINCPEVEILSACKNAEEAIKSIDSLDPDIVFLDIAMPGKSGIQMLKDLQKIDFMVIFITAYDQYMLQAIRLSAVDYLLKPIHEDDLIEAVKKARAIMLSKEAKPPLDTLYFNNEIRSSKDSKICIPISDGFIIKDIPEIIYCEADNTYTKFYLKDGTCLLVSKPLATYDTLMSECNFVRIHKSYLVNISHIASFSRSDGGSVLMSNGVRLDVSKRRKEILLDALKKSFVY